MVRQWKLLSLVAEITYTFKDHHTINAEAMTKNRNIIGDEIVRHSLIMVVFTATAGFFNYLYQLSMGILLRPEQYGILYSLNSIIIILLVFHQAITLTIAKFTSALKTKGNLAAVSYIWRQSLKRALLIGVATSALFVGLSPLFSGFLNVGTVLYPVITFSSVVIILALGVNYGTMQGLQRFLSLGFNQALLGALRLSISVLLVYFGMGIYGGLTAIPVSFGIAFFVAIFFLRDLRHRTGERVAVSGTLSSYALFSILAIFAITMLSNVDAVLARHYLSPVEAGNYSAVSVLGKIAYYAPIGVSVAMFPKSSELFENGGDHRRLLLKAQYLTLAIVGGVVLVYGLLPDFVVRLVFGGKYPLAAPHLFTYGLSMGFLGICYLLVNYLLSVNEIKVAYSLFGAMFIQICLIVLFHASIAQMVTVVLVSSIISVASIMLFYLKSRKRLTPNRNSRN